MTRSQTQRHRRPKGRCNALACVSLLIALAGLAGCTLLPQMAPHLDPVKAPIEADETQVAHCRPVGVFIQEVDPGLPSQSAERVRCELRVREQARDKGATHLVWLYRYPTGVAARGFRCPTAAE